jgi:hypothetical protein
MKNMVYVAGPITLPKGAMRENAVRACRVGELVVEAGMVPLIPHLSVFWGETMADVVGYKQHIPCDLCGKLPVDHKTGYIQPLCCGTGIHGFYTPSPNGIYGYETWLEMCFVQLSRCDALFRMAGESAGADREVAFAKERGIPVFYNIDSMKLWNERLAA